MDESMDAAFRTIVDETTLCGIFVIDREARIASWNRGAELLYGFTRDEIVGRPFADLFSADAVSEGVPAQELALADTPGLKRCPETWAARKDGSLFRASGTIMALQGSTGAAQGYYKCIQDVSPQWEAQQEVQRLKTLSESLQAQQCDKDEFISLVSHELRTPLQAMLGWTRLLRSGKLDGGASGKALEVIERSARTQAHLIEEFLDVSRMITGRLLIESESLDFSPLVVHAVAAAKSLAAAKNIEFVEEVQTDASWMQGDPERLRQIVENLLSNALAFTPPAGRIHVKFARSGDRVAFTVSDTGRGIAPEVLPQIFEGFKHEQHDSCRKGLCLGLSIVHRLVELHHGTIQAQSPGPGQGATFMVELPLEQSGIEQVGLENRKACDEQGT